MISNSIKHITVKSILVLLSILIYNCDENSTEVVVPENTSVTLKIYYTNDEHGWMQASGSYLGAAGMKTKWVNEHGFNNDGSHIVLSGGDMWTGPAISTWFMGEPMVEVMNALNYQAAAIGNHEFDFSQEGLSSNLSRSDFPYLAANLKSSTTGDYPDFVQPYVLIETEGIKLGIIGITTTATITINFPDNVEGLQIIPYTEALDEVVPELRNQGAEILILLSHVPSANMMNTRSVLMDYGISIVGCGDSHDIYDEESENFTMFEAGSNLTHYAYVEVGYDTLNNELISLNTEIIENSGNYTPDPDIQSIVNNWESALNNELSDVIGYTQTGIERRSPEMYNMVADSWLIKFPDADISLSNYGGVRQGLTSGEISLADIVGILPFDNRIIKLDLTGNEVQNILTSLNLFAGGLNANSGYLLSEGDTLDLDEVYTVLFTDYIYTTNEVLQQYDPSPEFTNVNFRDPVIEWISSLNTTESDPLENYLDFTLRQ